MSQLDAAIHEKQRYFESRFRLEGEAVPLPPEYLSLPGASQLSWKCYAEIDAFDPDEFAEHYAWFKKKPHWSAQTADGNDCVVVQTGYLWVGQMAT